MGQGAALVRGLGVAGAALASGCSNVAPPRAELVVIVDIDAPVPDQLAAHPELSADASIDTLRIEVSTASWSLPFASQDFIAPDPADWPLSFGIATGDVPPGQPVLLRLRAFRAQLAVPGESQGTAILDPWPEVTIDRLVEIQPPASGIRRVGVTLTNDCFGVYSVFGPGAPMTCVNHGPLAKPTAGVVDVTDSGDTQPSQVGTWAGAISQPCAGTAPQGATCVPGGFTIVGDYAFVGLGNNVNELDPAPLRPVLVAPFYMDPTEVTVGRFNALLKAGTFGGTLPIVQGDPSLTGSEFCTWLGMDVGQYDAEQDALPLNCITHDAATAVCAALGGALPSEAQWEHAARGRGIGNLYPWGDYTPSRAVDCCLVSASRAGAPFFPDPLCTGSGAETVGSHRASAWCGGLGDQTRDGILDLGGSLTEAMRDNFAAFDAGCWTIPGGGVLDNPVCQIDGSLDFMGRGGNWANGFGVTASPRRYYWTPEIPPDGVRCVYAGVGP